MTQPVPDVPGAILDQFGALLTGESGALHDFIALLRREQEMLSADNAESLAQVLVPLAEQKSNACRQLEDLGRQRQLFLSRYGLPGASADIQAWAAGRPPLLAAWQTLLQQAQQARDLNSQNGKLINLRMQHNQGALTVLLNAANRVPVYGPDGHQPGGFGRGRILGSG